MAWINGAQQRRDHNGQRNTCAACGTNGTAKDPLVKSSDGYRIHNGHTTDHSSGYFGQRQR